MTTPLPPKRKAARESLPPIYVRVSATGELSNEEIRDKDYCYANEGIPGMSLPCKCWPMRPGDRIVKYLPAPRAGKAKGGKRG